MLVERFCFFGQVLLMLKSCGGDMGYTEILDYWFGDAKAPAVDNDLLYLWFGADEDNDKYIQNRFQNYVSLAGEGKFSAWLDKPRGLLAHIILLDQFPRNIYRHLGAAFRYDEFALALCKKGLANGQDQRMPLIQRAFFYMPLQHSEQLEDQDESLFRFNQLCEAASDEELDVFDNFFDNAQKHHEIISRFHRFPHRNIALRRISTKEELQWLRESGMRFGQ